MGLLQLCEGQSRCSHLPLVVRHREESVVGSISRVLQKTLLCIFYLPSSNPLCFIHHSSPSLDAWLQ